MARILNVAGDKLNLSDSDKNDLRLAALLHDIGHYPYSHLMEGVEDVILAETFVKQNKSHISRTLEPDEEKRYPSHEELGRVIVCNQADIRDTLGGKDRAEQIAELFTRSAAAPDQLSKLIHSSLDMDRLDYLVRDARSAGVPYGEIDLNYLLQNVRTSPTGMIGIDYKAMTAAEQFLLARFFMHKAVYFHKTTFGLEEAFRQLIRRCRDKQRHNVPRDGDEVRKIASDPKKLLMFTDSFLDRVSNEALKDQNITIKTLAHAIVYRRPPKLLREEYTMVDEANEESRKHNSCTSLLEKCKTELPALARKHEIPLGLFLLAQPKSIRLEKRGALMTQEQATQQPPEPKDELIKVFSRNGRNADEPKSLVDFSESVLHACAQRSFRIVRLYVVEQDHSKVSKMRHEVRVW